MRFSLFLIQKAITEIRITKSTVHNSK